MRCVICQTDSVSTRFKVFFKCDSCSHMWFKERISEEQIIELYSKDYFFGQEYVDYVADEAALKKNFRRRINFLNSTFIDGISEKRVLEIGSAYGYFLDEARNAGALATGIDISDDGVSFSRRCGHTVYLGDYLYLNFDEKFDVIVMWDTIEHLNDPKSFVRKAYEDLVPGGRLIVSTGDCMSFNARLRGKNWRMIHPPTHLHYFSANSATNLFEECGFSDVNVKYDGQFRNLGSMLRALLKRMGIISTLERFIPKTNLYIYLNLFDIMTIWGIKK